MALSYLNTLKVQAVEWYISTESVSEVQRRLRREYPDFFKYGKGPDRNSILKCYNNFREYGDVNDRRKSKSGSQKTVRTAQNIERVCQITVRSPQLSSNRLSQILNISQTSVVRILKQDIKMFPYKIQILQTQTDANKAMRVEFSRQMAERIENDPDLLENLIFTDEAHVELSGYINKQNWRFWAFENPHMYIEKPKMM